MRYLFLSLLLLGCGGQIVGDPDASTDGGTTNIPCSMNPPTCFCGSPQCVNNVWACPRDCTDGSSTSCLDLSIQLSAKRNQLQSCCPACKKLQCNQTVQDVCCTITVNSGETTDFTTLVEQYKSKCHPACPDIKCPPAPSGICKQAGTDPNTGACQ